MSFLDWWKRIFFTALIVFISATFLSLGYTIFNVSGRLNALADRVESEFQGMRDPGPEWVRLEQAGFRNYKIDPGRRLIVIRY